MNDWRTCRATPWGCCSRLTWVRRIVMRSPTCSDESRELRSWLDSFDVRCVRRTIGAWRVRVGRSRRSRWARITGCRQRESRQARLRAEACDLFVLFERALTRGEIAAGHVDALAMAIRDLNDEQRFGLIDREERLLEAAMRMRVDDFVRHCRVQAADVVAELNRSRRGRVDAMTTRPTRIRSPMGPPDAEPIGSAAPTPDPLVVEYLRQRDGSKVRRWRDVEHRDVHDADRPRPASATPCSSERSTPISNALRAEGSHHLA